MRVLFLAPQPFFQERGTPIAVKLAVEVLASRLGDSVDLLTYHEGDDIEIENVTHHRIPKFSWLNDVRPGISLKKIFCDLLFTISVLQLLWRNRKNQYSVIHAVEESVFIALAVKLFFGIPYIYDMDSSLASQIIEKWKYLSPVKGLLEWLEKVAVRNSIAVIPVCDALDEIARSYGASEIQILRDISLLDLELAKNPEESLRETCELSKEDAIALYVGNLEHYQGIDLLLESFSITAPKFPNAHVIIIGGNDEDITRYRELSDELNVTRQVHLIGPRPVSRIAEYLLQADILLSPRTKGNNTPMKIYSYLHAGKAIVATDLPTHTQVLNDSVAVLGKPNTLDFSSALAKAFDGPREREKIGAAAFELAEREYTFEAFSKNLNWLYNKLCTRLTNQATG